MSTPLEEAARVVAAEMRIPADVPMTDEQAAEFRKRFAEVAARYELTILPRSSLTEDEVRQLLRECVTVVKPGELLVIRVSEDFTPNQLREYNNLVAWWLDENAPGVKCLVTIGEELGVTKAVADA